MIFVLFYSLICPLYHHANNSISTIGYLFMRSVTNTYWNYSSYYYSTKRCDWRKETVEKAGEDSRPGPQEMTAQGNKVLLFIYVALLSHCSLALLAKY